MPIPRVAIVGRPNVGKSSLLNLIAHEKIAIVDDIPGVTRDRVSAIVEIDAPGAEGPPRPVELVDTGGFGVYVAQGQRFDEVGNDLTRLTPDIEHQIAEAARTSDVILFCVDAQAGVTPADWEIATMLRERSLGRRARSDASPDTPGEPVVRVVATKTDSITWEPHALEASALGFGEPLMVSSTTKYLRRAFLDELYTLLPDPSDEDPRIEAADLRIAIVGKRNAGKSTLINTLAGEDRVIVSEIPGTTRDAIDVRFEIDGRSVVAIDTAGLRRRKSFQGRVEHYAFDRARRAIMRSDVVVLMIDAMQKVSQVDEHLAQIINEHYKPCVICVNKLDLIEDRHGRDGRPVGIEHYDEYLRRELKGLAIAPIAMISAQRGDNVRELIDLCHDLKQQASRRVGTGRLNRLVRSILETRGPSSSLGTMVKIYFVSQVRAQPPTIVLVVNRPDLFTANYQRYLLNRLHEELPFEEVPIRLIIRSRRKRDRDLERGEAIDTQGQVLDDELVRMLREMPDDAGAYFDDDPNADTGTVRNP